MSIHERLRSGAIATALASVIVWVGESSSLVGWSGQLDRFSVGMGVNASNLRDLVGASDPGPRIVANATLGGCATYRIGEITVATLRNAPFVILLANGKRVTLLLDTGAASTILTPAAAQRVGAQPPRIQFQRQISGLGGGTLATNEVELRSFSAGGVAIPWRRVLVASVDTPSVLGALDGVLGADVLSNFDVDLDLPHYRMSFYSKQSCTRVAPAWTAPYATITAGRSRSDHLFFPVQLDGRRVYAFFDTGSQLSVVSSDAALALGVSKAALARDQPAMTRDAAAEQLNSHIHRFSQLEIGSEIVRHPEFIVADVKVNDADLVLGINFLISRRIWLSYGSQQIFLALRR